MPSLQPNPEIICERPTSFLRYRIVVPAFDEEQAKRLAEKIREFCGCEIETVWIMANGSGEKFGEVVMKREAISVSLTTPNEVK